MEEVRNHFCFGDGSHSDNCSCQCTPCIARTKEIERDKFSKQLHDKMKTLMLSKSFRGYLVDAIIKK